MTTTEVTNPLVVDATKYLELYRRKARYEFELKKIKAELSKLGDPTAEGFIENGMTQLVIDGATLYIKRSVFAGVEPEYKGEAAAKIAQENGYGDIVSLQSTKLTSLVRQELADLLADDEADKSPESLKHALPEWLAAIARVGIKHQLCCRGAGMMADDDLAEGEEGDESADAA